MMSSSSVEATTAKQLLVNCKDEEIVPTRGKRKPLSKDGRNHPKKMFKSSYEERFGETSYFLDAGLQDTLILFVNVKEFKNTSNHL